MGISPTYFFEISAFIVGTITAYVLLSKENRNLAHKYLGYGNFIIGVYPLCIFIYDIIIDDWAVQVFLRIAMISLLFGMLFIYYTMYILMNSSHTFQDSNMKYINFLICLLASLYFIIFVDIDSESTVEGFGNVNISVAMSDFVLIGAILLYMLIEMNLLIRIVGLILNC